MEKPNKITDEHWARIEKTDFLKIAHRLCTPSYSEKYTVDMIHMVLILEDGESVLKVPKIERYRLEFNLKGARADILLYHKDGGITIVEVKSDSSVRDVAAGIGQLCWYEALIPNVFKGNQPKYVRKLLVTTLSPDKAGGVDKACKTAGVQLVLLKSGLEMAERYRELWEKNQHGA